MYAIERLTAPKPTWELAVVFSHGVEAMPIGKGFGAIRRDGDWLIIRNEKVDFPDKRRPSICDAETHMHIDEIVRIDFYENLSAAPMVKLPPKPGIIMP